MSGVPQQLANPSGMLDCNNLILVSQLDIVQQLTSHLSMVNACPLMALQ
jgi:hypothetical protein